MLRGFGASRKSGVASMIGRDVPTVYSSDPLSRISVPVKKLGHAVEPYEELLKYAAWHLLAAYIDPNPADCASTREAAIVRTPSVGASSEGRVPRDDESSGVRCGTQMAEPMFRSGQVWPTAGESRHSPFRGGDWL
jgi:hypothetical protein